MKKRGGAIDRKPTEGRSVTVSVRLDPRLRYFVELAARQQRRSLSSFIEWAIEESLTKVKFADDLTFAAKAQELWDVHAADRLAKLAEKYPYLLDYEQQVLWKLIEECHSLWLPEQDVREETYHLPFNGRLKTAILRERWKDFESVASGNSPSTILSDLDDSKSKHSGQKRPN